MIRPLVEQIVSRADAVEAHSLTLSTEECRVLEEAARRILSAVSQEVTA